MRLIFIYHLILAKPYFTVEPEIQHKAEDETVVFSCEAEGVPQPIVRWYHNGKPINQAERNPRRNLDGNTITITRLKKTDTGNYACNASNSNGYVFKDVYLNVLALEPQITDRPEDTMTVDGNELEMTCKVFGSPQPEITWMKGRTELTGGRYKIQDDGNLLIKKVMFTDAGQYTCFARNKLGNDSASASLVVKERTRITDEPEDYEVAAGSTSTFRCNAVADSTLDLSIDWEHNREKIDFDIEPRFIQSSDMSLTITKTNELDSGSYTCVARTELDERRAYATLIVQGKT